MLTSFEIDRAIFLSIKEQFQGLDTKESAELSRLWAWANRESRNEINLGVETEIEEFVSD